jgi:leucyl aminopeptidase
LVYDDTEEFVKDVQEFQSNLSTDFLKNRINENKIYQLELFNESSSKYFVFLDTSKLSEDNIYLESPIKMLTNPKATSILSKVESEKQRDLNIKSKISNENVLFSLLNQIDYNNFKSDYKMSKPSEDSEKTESQNEEKDFGNKVVVDNIFVDSDHLNPSCLEKVKIINESVALTRNLVNLRADLCTPTFFCENVKSFAEHHCLEHEIIVGDDLLEKGLNMIHAVGRSANSPPALAIVHYKGNPDDPENQ